MTSIKHFFEIITETLAADKHLWNPTWWYLMAEKVQNNLTKKESTPMDISTLETWKNAIQRVSRMWSTCFEAWEITSFKELLTRSGNTLGHIYKWSLSPQILESLVLSWITLTSMDPIPEESCSDMSLRKTISMCFIPAHSPPGSVSAVGEEKFPGESGDLNDPKERALEYTGVKRPSKTGDCPTGCMSSSISFFESGEKEAESKLGLTVPIKDFFVVVSTCLFCYNSIIKYAIIYS